MQIINFGSQWLPLKIENFAGIAHCLHGLNGTKSANIFSLNLFSRNKLSHR